MFQTGITCSGCVVGVIAHHDTIGGMERIDVGGVEFKNTVGENGWLVTVPKIDAVVVGFTKHAVVEMTVFKHSAVNRRQNAV